MAATVQLSSQPYCGLCQGKAQTQPLTCQRSASFRSCAGIRAGQLSRFKAGSRNKPHQVTAESLLQSSSRCIRSHAHATACRARAHGSSASHGGVDSEETDVIIVGAGLAGLSAAHMLQKASVPFVLLEASDGVGGRVRTDSCDGFLLDRGFQIFLTSYPECKALLDYPALDLQPFYAGASVRFDGGWHRVADPVRHLVDAIGSLANPIGSPIDKLRVGLFRLKSLLGSTYSFIDAKETSTLQQLQGEGFSTAIIDRFFRPFLGGIFFDNELRTSSRLTTFVMRMLATGSNCLPAGGIGAITQQLASQLPADSIRLGCPVKEVIGSNSSSNNSSNSSQCATVVTEAKQRITASRGVIVATEGPAALKLLEDRLGSSPSAAAEGVGTCCVYFAADAPPAAEPVLYLNGDGGGGVVNNVCFPSTVAASYAPPDQTLVSVAVVGTRPELNDQQLQTAVKDELSGWWGGQVAHWRHLRTYRIPFAQPNQVAQLLSIV